MARRSVLLIEAIEEEREAAGLSQAQICRLAGVHNSIYSKALRRPGAISARSLIALNNGLESALLLQQREAAE